MTLKLLRIFLTSALALCAQNTAKFPLAVPTAAQMGVASNRAETTLTAGINATATSIPVASSAGMKSGSFVTLDNEQIAICAVPDGTHLTVGVSACPNVDGRGIDTANGGGAAASHLSAAKVQGRIVAWHQNQAAAEVIAIATKLHNELVSVKDFGAKGDGSTNDYTAIMTAHSAAVAAGVCLFFPAGTYNYGTAISLSDENTCWTGTSSSTLKYTGGVAVAWSFDGTGAANGKRLTLRTLTLDGGNATDGFFFNKAVGFLVEQVRVTNVAAAALHCTFCVTGTIRNFIVSSNVAAFSVRPVNGILLDGASSNVTILSPKIEGLGGAGISASNGQNLSIVGGTSEGNVTGSGMGISLVNSKYSVISGMDLESNTAADITCGEGCNFNTFQGGVQISATSLVFTGHAVGNAVYGGLYNTVSLGSQTRLNRFYGVTYYGAGVGGFFTDSGANNEQIGTLNGTAEIWDDAITRARSLKANDWAMMGSDPSTKSAWFGQNFYKSGANWKFSKTDAGVGASGLYTTYSPGASCLTSTAGPSTADATFSPTSNYCFNADGTVTVPSDIFKLTGAAARIQADTWGNFGGNDSGNTWGGLNFYRSAATFKYTNTHATIGATGWYTEWFAGGARTCLMAQNGPATADAAFTVAHKLCYDSNDALAINGTAGLSQAINVRKSDNSGACTITVTSGLVTATTCP